ncbi:MAG: thiol-disulfide oxidoreductase DCC family protein [Tepidisphaerales bacterium]
MTRDGRPEQPTGDPLGPHSGQRAAGRSPADVPARVILADGHCLLCSRAVRLIRRWDRTGGFRFLALGSPQAHTLLAGHPLPPGLDSVVLWEGGRVYTHEEAVFRVLPHLARPWRWLAVLRRLPRSWTNAAYRWVARHRYRLFGKSDVCLISGELPAADLALGTPRRPLPAPSEAPPTATPAGRPAAPHPREGPSPGDGPR